MANSILKQVTGSNEPMLPTFSREERNKETALYHANLIQHRKETQNLILESTEILLEFPSSPTSNPAHPIERDVVDAKRLLRSFQPSDYDSLVQERNIDKKCGYIFCPRSNRLEGTDAKYRILGSKGKNSYSLHVVERQELEHWCSDACGKRALYLRIQLSDEPAWARSTASSSNFTLLEEADRIQQSLDSDHSLIEGFQRLDVKSEEERVIDDMRELAIERGDGNAPERRARLIEMDIHENEGSAAASPIPPNLRHHASSGLSNYVEGYETKFTSGKMIQDRFKSGQDETEDIMPTI